MIFWEKFFLPKLYIGSVTAQEKNAEADACNC
jgi:hypothetical protein